MTLSELMDGDRSSYLDGAYSKIVWDQNRWNLRKEMFADIWDQKSVTVRKRIIAMLVMHAADVRE